MPDRTAWDREIVNKWPVARASGPDVTTEQAREYIFRTDNALIRPEHACNDSVFCAELATLIGNTEDWDAEDAYINAVGHIRLNHFDSNWVASSYVGGPNGIVSPFGEVSVTKNFGKWPSVEEIESDLDLLTAEFPWLSFKLWLWDSAEESAAVRWGNDPTHAWEISAGYWRRIPTEGACKGELVPTPRSISPYLPCVLSRCANYETTWTVQQIEEMWGDRIRSAQSKVMESI